MMECHLTRAERYAVDQYRARLERNRGEEVSFDEALERWLTHEAKAWREERQRACMARQRDEINRHKWIESEKAGRDLGKDAVLDWISNNAEAWRRWYEQECVDTSQ
jgi:hypothetical protein